MGIFRLRTTTIKYCKRKQNVFLKERTNERTKESKMLCVRKEKTHTPRQRRRERERARQRERESGERTCIYTLTPHVQVPE